MAPPELQLSSLSQSDDAGILSQNAHCKHVANYDVAVILRYRVRSIIKPGVDLWSGDATLLQHQCHHLLRVDMGRAGWRSERLNDPLSPKEHYSEVCQKLLVISRQKEEVTSGARPPPSPSHSLNE